MLTQTCSTQIQASVSAPHVNSRAQSKSQEWGQEGFCETPDQQRQRNVPLLDIEELREKQTDRRNIYCRDHSTSTYDSASSKDAYEENFREYLLFLSEVREMRI